MVISTVALVFADEFRPTAGARSAANAMWVKKDGRVETPEIVSETSDAYMLGARLASGSTGMVGISKSQIVFCSMSARSWFDLCKEILERKQIGVFDQIAIYYESHREIAPRGALELIEHLQVFNRLPERLRHVIVKLATRELADIDTTTRSIEEAIDKFAVKIASTEKDASGEAARTVTKQSVNPLTGGTLSSSRPAYSDPQQAALRASARRSAVESLFQGLMTELSSPVARLAIADASEIVADLQQRKLIKVAGRGFDRANIDIVTTYKTFTLLNVLLTNLHAPGARIAVPDIENQNLFDRTSSKVRMTNDEKFGAFQLVVAGEDEVFISSVAVPAGPTQNTRNLCLSRLSPSMKSFFNSEAAKSGKFLLAAAPLAAAIERRGEVSFLRATPVLVLTPGQLGEMQAIYAQPEIAQKLASATAFSLEEPNKPIAAGKTDDSAAVGKLDVGKTLKGSWTLTSSNLNVDLEVDAEGYSTDRKYRIREAGGLILLRTPEDSWTMSWQRDGSLAGKSDTGATRITLKRP